MTDSKVSEISTQEICTRKYRFIRFGSRLTGAVLLCILALFTFPATAQVTTADVVGTVADNTGGILPNIPVSIVNLDTHIQQNTQTTSTGDFDFSFLSPGRYTVTVTVSGFKTFSSTVVLAAGDRVRVNPTLPIGATAETVNVESITPALKLDSSDISALIPEKAVQDVPLNGRNYINLAQITQGANEGPPKGLSSGLGSGTVGDRRPTSDISVNGQADLVNNEMIDGVDNNERLQGTIGVRPSIESIAEIRVISNLYPAELSRTAGGVINIITKGGTDKFHGSAYEFFRNDILNASPYQFGAHLRRPELRQNQFGGALGGPIRPERTFFFADYEGLRLIQGGTTTSSTVPTAYEHAHPGDFSDVGGPVYTGTQLDQSGVDYFELFPLPNAGATTYVNTPSNFTKSATVDGRFDNKFNDANSAFLRYTYNGFTENLGSLLPKTTVAGVSVQPTGSIATVQAHSAQFNYLHTFNEHLVTQATMGYLGLFIEEIAANYGLAVNSAFGQPNINISPDTSGLAPLLVSGYPQLGGAGNYAPLGFTDNAYQYATSTTYQHGAHSYKVGATFIRRQATNVGSQYGDGNYAVTSLQNLVQGVFSSSQRGNQLFAPHLRTSELGVYAQDDWHLGKNLTLNLGLRYDLYTPYTEAQNHISNFDFANPSVGMLIAGQNGVNNRVNQPISTTDFSPRVGFAYSPFAGAVLRGGYGITFVPENLNSTAYLANQPFYSVFGPCSTATCVAPYNHLINGLPLPVPTSATAITGTITAAESPSYQPTYFHQFNLTAQKDFSGNVVTLTYVGMLGVHVVQRIPDFNAPPPNTCSPNGSACTNALRPYYAAQPNLTVITGIQSEGASNYNALEVVYERRTKKGLTVGANFTWSRGLDDAYALARPAGSGDGFGFVPSQIRVLDYGNSDVDVRDRFAATADYELPFGKSLTGWKAILAKDWQTNMLMVWSGTNPFTVTNATTASQTSTNANSDRPNQIASERVANPSPSAFFNTAAFVKQPLGTLGSEHRNQFYGPHYRHVDLSVFKTFPLHAQINLQFRAEAYNITNTTNFNTPNTSLGTATFGQLTSTIPYYNPRTYQFALKLQF